MSRADRVDWDRLPCAEGAAHSWRIELSEGRHARALHLASDEPHVTVPFFGVAEARGSLWAVGGDGLYHFDAKGLPSFTAMPAFYDADGVDVSFALPGVALARTTINAHVSLSGAVPLLAPR